MKINELTGAQLDYYTARAEGIPHADIFWRKGGDFWTWGHDYGYSPSTDWAQGGPLIEKHLIHLAKGINQILYPGWTARTGLAAVYRTDPPLSGATALEAACRAVVAQAFGADYEFEEVAVC